MNQANLEQIGALIHRSFKVANGGVQDIVGIMGSSQASGDLRKELFESLSDIQTEQASQESLDSFHARVQVAQSLGVLDGQVVSRIYKLLEEV